MPQLKPLKITVDATEIDFPIAGNSNGITSWARPGVNQKAQHTVVSHKRNVTPAQTTRKTTLTKVDPLVDSCPTTCNTVDRGNLLFKVEFISSVQSTQAEREQAVSELIEVLNLAETRDALTNNESYWS